MKKAVEKGSMAACPVCGRADNLPLLVLEDIPVLCNFLYSSREEALGAPMHDLELCICLHCAHLFNSRFEQDRIVYEQGYENSLFYSPRYRAYATKQARRLIDTYSLKGGKVIDIGCGNGEFLDLLHQLGGCTGIGYDPSMTQDAATHISQAGIRLIREYYPENQHVEADLFVSRHVLEHLADPVSFLNTLGKTMAVAGPVLFLEVPNGEQLLHAGSVWDIIYEHYSYFTRQSLLYLLESNRFSVMRLQAEFDGQYLAADAQVQDDGRQSPGAGLDREKVTELGSAAQSFAQTCGKKLAQAKRRAQEEINAGREVAVWGAGSKGISFLNRIGRTGNMRYVVDINPRKQGKYVPGTGQKVVGPAILTDLQPATIFIANPIYAEEIEEHIMQIDISPELVCI